MSDRLQHLCNIIQTAIPNSLNKFTVHYTNNLQCKIKGKITSINTAFRVRGTGKHTPNYLHNNKDTTKVWICQYRRKTILLKHTLPKWKRKNPFIQQGQGKFLYTSLCSHKLT